VPFGTPAVVPPTNPLPFKPAPTGDAVSTSAPNLDGPAKAGPSRVDKIWIAKAALIKKHKKVYLVVRVKAKYAKKAALKARVLGKRKRKLGSWTKSVKTNKTIKLKVNARARTARLSLAD
jgi:hypothetical protein